MILFVLLFIISNMKKRILFAIASSIGVTLATISSKVDSAPSQSKDEAINKAAWIGMMTEMPKPLSNLIKDTLVDVTGAKSNCHTMPIPTSVGKRKIVDSNCWGKKGNTFNPLAAQWVKSNKKILFSRTNLYTDPAPASVGNTLIDSKKRQYDCHLTSHLINNQEIPVSRWTCWSNTK